MDERQVLDEKNSADLVLTTCDGKNSITVSSDALRSSPLYHAHIASQGQPIPISTFNNSVDLDLFQLVLTNQVPNEKHCLQLSTILETAHRYEVKNLNFDAICALAPRDVLLSPLAEQWLCQHAPRRQEQVRKIIVQDLSLAESATFLHGFLKNATLEERIFFRPERFPFSGEDVGLDNLFLLPVMGRWLGGRHPEAVNKDDIATFLVEQNIRDYEFFPKGNAHKREWPPLEVAINQYKSWTMQFELDELMEISKSFQGKASLFCAGGSFVLFLTSQREEIAKTDLDLFVIAEDKSAQKELLSQCLQFLEVRFKATFIVHGAVVTVSSPWLAHKMQFVITNFKRPAEVLYNFDCSCVQFGMTESMELLATPEALLFTPYMLNVMTRHTFRYPRFQKCLKRRFLPVALQETIYIMHGNRFFEFAAVIGDGGEAGESIGPKGLVRAKELVRMSHGHMSCDECECDHGPAVTARIEERPEPQETILDAVGALAAVNYGPLWANLLGDYHQHVFSSCHSVQEVFTEFGQKGWEGVVYIHIWNCVLEEQKELVTGWMDPQVGTSSLHYMHERCDVIDENSDDQQDALLITDPCTFHPKNTKQCPPRSRVQVPWRTDRTIDATPLVVLNHSGSCVKVERVPGGANFHMLLAVTADKWEISLIHLVSPVVPLILGQAKLSC
jgi:hypothetical protein